MLAQILAAEQPLFFGRYRGEQHRVREGEAVIDRRLPDPRHLEQHGDARTVVSRAVVYVVAGFARHDSKVVVVGGVEHGLVRSPVVQAGPGQHTDDIRALEWPDGAGDRSLQLHRQLNGTEAALACGGKLLVQVHAGRRKDLAGDLQLNPAGRLQARVGVIAKKGLLGGVGVLHNIPAVARQVGAMNDQRASGAHARSLLKLVRPAAIVGQGLAPEELRVV